MGHKKKDGKAGRTQHNLELLIFHQTKATGNHPVALLFMLSECKLLSAFLFYLLYCRYRKVTI